MKEKQRKMGWFKRLKDNWKYKKAIKLAKLEGLNVVRSWDSEGNQILQFHMDWEQFKSRLESAKGDGCVTAGCGRCGECNQYSHKVPTLETLPLVKIDLSNKINRVENKAKINKNEKSNKRGKDAIKQKSTSANRSH